MSIRVGVVVLCALSTSQMASSVELEIADPIKPESKSESLLPEAPPQVEASIVPALFSDKSSSPYLVDSCEWRSNYDGAGCCSGCNDCCNRHPLFGLPCFRRSDHCFDDFISPVSNPVFFEDPRTLSEIRFLFIQHELPHALAGGSVQLVAAQVRAALTERLSLIATKDGFIFSHNAPHSDGWADISLGLKYNLLRDPCCQRIVSLGLVYELPVGSQQALQGNGDGEFNLFLSAAAEYGAGWHYMTATGFRLPTNHNEESSVWYWSNHLDHRLDCTPLYLFGEVNWFHWMRAGTQTALAGIEGNDLYNFGSAGVAGKDILTGAVGFKYKPHRNTEIGIAYETHLTDERDLLENRVQFDWILRF